MKLSIDPNDPAYMDSMAHLNVMLNGKLTRDVITADEDEGYIVQYKRDRSGRKIIIDGVEQTERTDGIVEIVGLPRRMRDELR